MCLVAFQKMFRKIFYDVWLCSSKYHRKHIFYLLFTFSHIFSVAKRIYNIIHFSKHKQNPEKNHQIRTLRAIAIAIEASRDRLGAGDLGRRFQRTISAISEIEALDDLDELGFGRSLLSLLSFSLSLFLSLSLSLFCA